MIRHLIISFSILLAPFLLSASGERPPVLLKGKITDVESGKVIPGAVISLEMNGEIIHSTQSNEKGYFQMQYEGTFLRMDNLKVSIYKEGYKLQKLKPLNREKEDMRIEMQKRPKLYPLIIPMHSQPAYDI